MEYNEKFNKWAKIKDFVLPLFTLMAGINLEALDLYNSEFGGFVIFKAPISECFNIYKIWANAIGLFLYKGPQLACQVSKIEIYIYLILF